MTPLVCLTLRARRFSANETFAVVTARHARQHPGFYHYKERHNRSIYTKHVLEQLSTYLPETYQEGHSIVLPLPRICPLPGSFGFCGQVHDDLHSHWLLGCAGLDHFAHQICLNEPVHRPIGAHDKGSSLAPISCPEQDDLGQILPFLLHLLSTTRDRRHRGTWVVTFGDHPSALSHLGLTSPCGADNFWCGWQCFRRCLFFFGKASRHSFHDDRHLAAREGPPAKRDAPFRDGALTFLKKGEKASHDNTPGQVVCWCT